MLFQTACLECRMNDSFTALERLIASPGCLLVIINLSSDMSIKKGVFAMSVIMLILLISFLRFVSKDESSIDSGLMRGLHKIAVFISRMGLIGIVLLILKISSFLNGGWLFDLIIEPMFKQIF